MIEVVVAVEVGEVEAEEVEEEEVEEEEEEAEEDLEGLLLLFVGAGAIIGTKGELEKG